MIIYIEKWLIDNEVANNIINKYKNAEVLKIDNYKNIFDKSIKHSTDKSIIIASVNNAISEAPLWYWHNWKWFFLKNSLNCIYDCSYCYLKWAFKNDIPVFFVNYEDIKSQIIEYLEKNKKNTKWDIWFYSSDYSDNLATDNLTNFTKEFIPFFNSLENVKLEIRTKSTNIKNLLELSPSKNVEIAFSLNPEEVIEKYELKTLWLDLRISAINKLIEKWWQVGIRFLPLIEIENYKEVYSNFLKYVTKKIDFQKVYSVFVWWLLYTKQDYNNMIKRYPLLDIFYKLEDSKDWFYRENEKVRAWFYDLFDSLIKEKKCNRCLDK